MSYSIIDRAVFGPRHAKQRNAFKIAAKGSAIAALLAASGFAGAGLAAMTPAPSSSAFAGQSATAVLTASYRVNWAQRTCSAFSMWEARPSAGNLRTLITDSLNVPWNKPGSKYGLGSDVYGLGGDVLGGKTTYIAKDKGYLTADCAG